MYAIRIEVVRSEDLPKTYYDKIIIYTNLLNPYHPDPAMKLEIICKCSSYNTKKWIQDNFPGVEYSIRYEQDEYPFYTNKKPMRINLLHGLFRDPEDDK